MSSLEAYRAQQTHRHRWTPFATTSDHLELEVCDCGALRPLQRPETD